MNSPTLTVRRLVVVSKRLPFAVREESEGLVFQESPGGCASSKLYPHTNSKFTLNAIFCSVSTNRAKAHMIRSLLSFCLGIFR